MSECKPLEQVRVALWSGVVRLENVRLRPDAFEHLNLPFAVRGGTIALLELKVRAAPHDSDEMGVPYSSSDCGCPPG